MGTPKKKNMRKIQENENKASNLGQQLQAGLYTGTAGSL